MFITDAQVHIWGDPTPERPWPEGGFARAHRVPALGAEELLGEMDSAGVDRAIIVPPSFEGDRNDVALAAAVAHPDRFAVMGRITLQKPGSADIAHWLEQPGMIGVRLTFHTGEPFEAADWFWREAASAGVPVMVFAPDRTEEFGEVAKANPGVRYIIDHLNIPTNAVAAQIAPAVEAVLPLADLPNVAVKVSALPCATDDGYPFHSLTPLVRRLVDAFGSDRCFWGSDISRLPCTYAEWVNAMAEGMGCLTSAETEQMMGKAISRWLNWPEP